MATPTWEETQLRAGTEKLYQQTEFLTVNERRQYKFILYAAKKRNLIKKYYDEISIRFAIFIKYTIEFYGFADVIVHLPVMRERVPGEITPASAVQSATFNDDVVHHGAELAIDVDLETANIANPTTDTPSPWIKLTLDKVYCVERV